MPSATRYATKIPVLWRARNRSSQSIVTYEAANAVAVATVSGKMPVSPGARPLGQTEQLIRATQSNGRYRQEEGVARRRRARQA